jgi:4-hydroxythreonine-4-phosphate dehydrogenase
MKKIAITMGDPAGIGPEITLKALVMMNDSSEFQYIIYGDKRVYEELNDRYKYFNSLDVLNFNSLDIIKESIQYGTIKAEYGKVAGDYIKLAIEDAIAKKVDAVVTCPIHKKSFQLGGYGEKYVGHTEMFADLTGAKNYSMMLAHGNLRVFHVTTHVPLIKAIGLINKDLVLEKIRLAYETCVRLKIKDIRIGVAGLNPHAGDEGVMGTEDDDKILPAVNQANKELNCTVEGPIPSDTIFAKALGGMYDALVVMYHDQGHIPIKTLGFKYDEASKSWSDMRGVNVTLGLPVIRSSVDHGTAFGKAGKNQASPDSLIDAIKYADLLI